MSLIWYNKVFVAKDFKIKSALEVRKRATIKPLNCSVFGVFKWFRKYFPHSSFLSLYFLFLEIFPVVMSVDLFSRVYRSCAPFCLF